MPRKKLELELMSKKEVAQAFKVSERTVDVWVTKGKFPAPVKVFGRPRWRVEDLKRVTKRD